MDYERVASRLEDIYSKLDKVQDLLIVAEETHERFKLDYQYMDKNILEIWSNTKHTIGISLTEWHNLGNENTRLILETSKQARKIRELMIDRSELITENDRLEIENIKLRDKVHLLQTQIEIEK